MVDVLKKVAYSTSATAHGGRDGHVSSADGAIDLDLARPGASDTPAPNPETLFASGYAACFQGALMHQAGLIGVDASQSVVTAEVRFGGTEDGGVGLAVSIRAELPGVGAEQAQQLVAKAHEFCPYSRATRGNIEVDVSAA